MKKFPYLSIVAIAALLSLSGCKKDKKTDPEPVPTPTPTPTPIPTPTPTPTYNIPSSYNFTSADFKSSTQRLAMFRELITYIRTTHTATTNVTINSANLQKMYENSGSPFADAGSLGLNASGISLKEKTNNITGMVNELEAIFVEAAATSQSTVGASDGVAGKLLGPAPTTTNGTQAAYLVNSKGFEYKELVEKGGMGAILYSQAMTILKDIGTLDNTTIVNGLTAQERAWDEAFGYFGVPVAFPTSTTGLLYWGSYCNSVNTAIGGFNQPIMDAWLKGRAAITNKDNANRDAARDIVVATWEKVGAARFITYLKQAKTNFASDGPRSHSLSEGVGFIRAFKYNPSRKITDAEINELMGYIGNNLYQVTQSNLDAAISKMATIFNLDQSKL
jgi:hypothetical protein